MLNLHEMSWIQAKEYFHGSDIVLLPVGSTEQHGPQNPLGTDHLIARSLAEEAAKRTQVLVLPTIPFGVSSHHRQFWGAIYVKPETFRKYVRDVCLSLAYYGVRKIVVVNGHGGNTRSLQELAREIRAQGLFMSVFIWWEAAKEQLVDIFSADERGHAAAEETSVNLALNPNLVDMNRVVDEKPRRLLPKASVGVNYGLDSVDQTDSGVLGVSSTASSEKGKKIFEVAVYALINHIEALKETRKDDLLPKSLR